MSSAGQEERKVVSTFYIIYFDSIIKKVADYTDLAQDVIWLHWISLDFHGRCWISLLSKVIISHRKNDTVLS
jgi:hypothetical protein